MKRIPNSVCEQERARLEEERRRQEAHLHSRTSHTVRDWSLQEEEALERERAEQEAVVRVASTKLSCGGPVRSTSEGESWGIEHSKPHNRNVYRRFFMRF